MTIRDQVREKSNEMVSQAIIEKVEGLTDRVSSINIVKKANGELRICLDPKDNNLAIKCEHFRLCHYKLNFRKPFRGNSF